MKRWIGILAIMVGILIPPSAARAGDPKFGEYVHVTKLPEAVVKTAPVYPEDARRAGVSGTVLVQTLIGKNGLVKDTRIVKSIPMLDSAAVACVRTWKFKPALDGSEPVAVWVAVPMKFTLDGASKSRSPEPPPWPRARERAMKPPPASRPPAIKGAPEPGKSLDQPSIDAFNVRLAAAGDSAWARSPTTIAIEFVGGAACECAHFSVEASSQPERFDDAEVIVTRDGLLDDSIRGDRHRLHLKRGDRGAWALESATVAWRCWQGRGHEDYSPNPCR